jgi:hypothetical protein
MNYKLTSPYSGSKRPIESRQKKSNRTESTNVLTIAPTMAFEG